MYLSELKIKHFRSIKDISLTFNPGINVLIGENNAGKTTVIDALRICLGYRSQDGLRVSKSDFHISKESSTLKSIEFDLSFEITDDVEMGYFIELYDANTETLDLHFRFNLKQYSKYERIHSEVWGGQNEGVNIPSEVFHSFIQVYLSALRDAERYLRPGRYNQLGELIIGIDETNFSDKYNRDEMADTFSEIIDDSDFSDFIREVNNRYIATHLDNMTFEKGANLDICLIDQDFDEMSRNLKIKLPLSNDASNDKFLELYQNGLGHNNLIYIAILLSRLSDLSKSEDSLYLSLLIEEPEAHLQPQLQNLFFSYLNELNKDLNESKSFQIFMTSHSPTLTAKADLDSLIILQKDTENENIVCANFKSLGFDDDNKEYLHKFLDVTKSQLLFSKRIVFVEGISEALLLPTFANKLGYNLDENGVEIVILNGITFKHFSHLFDEDNPLIFKGSFITDDDRKEFDGDPSSTFENLKLFENNNLEIHAAFKTFEYELLNCNEKDSLIYKTFKDEHPQLFKNLLNNTNEEIFDILDSSKIHKADIALKLSILLNENNHEVPGYISNAIKFVCK